MKQIHCKQNVTMDFILKKGVIIIYNVTNTIVKKEK